MKFLALLLAPFLCATIVFAQKPGKDIYRCLPCGSECDKASYNEPGKCTHCGMKLVPEATITFAEVQPTAICDYVDSHPKTILLDVRTKHEFEGRSNPNFGTLKGAINIPIQELPQRLEELEKFKDNEILVFCSHSHRSPQVAYLLNQNGFKQVKNMAGGMSVVQDIPCKK